MKSSNVKISACVVNDFDDYMWYYMKDGFLLRFRVRLVLLEMFK